MHVNSERILLIALIISSSNDLSTFWTLKLKYLPVKTYFWLRILSHINRKTASKNLIVKANRSQRLFSTHVSLWTTHSTLFHTRFTLNHTHSTLFHTRFTLNHTILTFFHTNFTLFHTILTFFYTNLNHPDEIKSFALIINF